MLVTVVVSRTAVLGNRHRHIDRIDGQRTVGNVERHRAEVVARILEIVSTQFHSIGTSVRTADR